jgi:hypothetical protein
LILSNQTDDNPVATICGEVQVLYRRPDADQSLPAMPSNAYVCRYSMAFGADDDDDVQGTVEVTPFSGDNDEWSEILAIPTGFSSKRPRSGNKDSSEKRLPSSKKAYSTDGLRSNETMSSTSSSDSETGRSFDHLRPAGLDEGTTEQRDIRVGPEHQVPVPAYVPNQKVVSRNPTLAWKRGKISQEEINSFLKQVSKLLSPYLRENRLTHEEPYSPLAWDDMETNIREAGKGQLPTLSSVCTASSLSKKRIDMLRECDVDAILKILHEKDYNTKAAYAAIQASPRDFLTVWSLREKELFNSGFRRYAGSLRMIYKGIAPSKGFQDVIDYHYRFKIPDQFRRFQDKKREQAVRMMECIETRRNINSVINLTSERNAGIESAPKKRNKEVEW